LKLKSLWISVFKGLFVDRQLIERGCEGQLSLVWLSFPAFPLPMNSLLTENLVESSHSFNCVSEIEFTHFEEPFFLFLLASYRMSTSSYEIVYADKCMIQALWILSVTWALASSSIQVS
jgi:hypothetical protein